VPPEPEEEEPSGSYVLPEELAGGLELGESAELPEGAEEAAELELEPEPELLSMELELLSEELADS